MKVEKKGETNRKRRKLFVQRSIQEPAKEENCRRCVLCGRWSAERREESDLSSPLKFPTRTREFGRGDGSRGDNSGRQVSEFRTPCDCAIGMEVLAGMGLVEWELLLRIQKTEHGSGGCLWWGKCEESQRGKS